MFPNLARQPRLFVDTETTGLSDRDRPVGLSVAWYDGEGELSLENTVYLRWGHEAGGNNCTLDEVVAWSRVELCRKDQPKIFHNAAFDMRMMAYLNIAGLHDNPWGMGPVEDTGFLSALNNENDVHSLDNLARKYGKSEAGKDEEMLLELQKLFDGSLAWGGKTGQAQNIWRAPGDLIETYARTDPFRTGEIWHGLLPRVVEQELMGVYELENQLIPILLKMHLVGVRINVEKAEWVKAYLKRQFGESQVSWDRKTEKILGYPANINSPNDLRKVFKHYEILGHFPLTAKGQLAKDRGEPAPYRHSFAAEHLETLMDEHWAPQTIMDIRRLNKYSDTFIDAYLLERVDENGVLHGQFNQVRGDEYGTVSGRFSSSQPNLQNIPSPERDPDGAKKIRGLFLPFEGYKWFKVDWSQIEFRFLAHYTKVIGYPELADEYHADPKIDFHQMVADLIGQKRYYAKNQNFGMVYGMGTKKLARKLGLSLEEAQPLFDQYHERMPAIKKLYNKTMQRADRRGTIKTWYGRKRHFMRKRGKRGFQRSYSALNALLQGSAADLMKLAMVEAVRSGAVDWENLILQLTVHDELDGSVRPNEEGDKRLAELKAIMENKDNCLGEIGVPILADPECGPSWGDVSKRSDPHPHTPTGKKAREREKEKAKKRGMMKP